MKSMKNNIITIPREKLRELNEEKKKIGTIDIIAQRGLTFDEELDGVFIPWKHFMELTYRVPGCPKAFLWVELKDEEIRLEYYYYGSTPRSENEVWSHLYGPRVLVQPKLMVEYKISLLLTWKDKYLILKNGDIERLDHV